MRGILRMLLSVPKTPPTKVVPFSCALWERLNLIILRLLNMTSRALTGPFRWKGRRCG